jgi:type IV pilus assembly protein PilE
VVAQKYAVHPDSRASSQPSVETLKSMPYHPHQLYKREQTMKFAKGFTLIEIMVTVAIIGILASLALPAYGNYVTRGKIPDATSNLASKRVLMEQFFQDNHSYLSGGACPTTVAPDTASSKYFNFACDPAFTTANTFEIEATGKGTMAGFSYTITESNTKGSVITAPANVNLIASSTTCWIINTGGTC